MYVLGIDPGLNGALALYDGYYLQVLEMPTVKAKGRGREIEWTKLAALWEDNFPVVEHVFLERVHSRPGEGVSSAFKFGLVFGGLYGMIAVKDLPLTLVSPRVWKKSFKLGADKKDAVEHAASLFPDYSHLFYGPKGGLKDGVAEATLIAFYGHGQLKG